MVFLPIAEYRPDIAAINTAYTEDVKNVLVGDSSYMPFPSFEKRAQPLPGRCYGLFSLCTPDSQTLIFAGTADKLYLLSPLDGSWTDVSRPDGPYSANAEARWSFAVFGAYVIAVNKNTAPQVFEIGHSHCFHNMEGNPPRAGLVRIWGDFVCLMQLPDNPGRVHWSGLNDITWWTPGQKNCDYQDFPEGGMVQGSTESSTPIIFMQSAIYMGNFVPGSDIIFSFKKIYSKRGAKSSSSIACRGTCAFYVDEGGFFQINSDGSLLPIGFEKVDKTIFSTMSTRSVLTMQAAVDPFNSRVYWAMDFQDIGTLNLLLVYDWVLGKWSRILIDLQDFAPLYMQGYSLEGLDKISPQLRNLPFSLDSKVWQGGSPVLGGISSEGFLGFFCGLPMEAVVTSAEYAAEGTQIRRISKITPVIDTQNCLLSVGTRLRRDSNNPLIWSKESYPSFRTGAVLRRNRSRFHKFKIRILEKESWTHLGGFNVDFSFAGQR